MAAKILIIDDRPDVGRAIARMLPAYETSIETDPCSAVSRFANGERFDVVLCDLDMPALSGREVYETIRRKYFERPPIVLMMSGHDNVAALFEAGCPVLFKPFSGAELRTLISGLLHESNNGFAPIAGPFDGNPSARNDQHASDGRRGP